MNGARLVLLCRWRLSCLMFVLCALASVSFADECRPCTKTSSGKVALVKDGIAMFEVVLAEDASRPERFAARELEKYLCLSGQVAADAMPSNALTKVPIRLVTAADSSNMPWDGDVFTIEADADGITVTGASPRGTAYGAYEILKTCAGMRWLVPGEDGEYCVNKSRTVEIPYGKTTHRPFLKIRETRTTGDEGGLWSLRNNMQSQGLPLNRFWDRKRNCRTEEADRLEELCEMGVGPCGHIQSTLLMADIGNESFRTPKEVAEAMFAKHPEWFPVENGLRKLIWGPNDRNPCVSNEKYLDHAAETICRWIDCPHGRDSYMTIGNNDTTLWCECENCKALDAPEAAGTKGEMSDRYWHMVNGIASRVWKRFPDAKFGGWAYQNYWYPPVRVKIDPRLKVFVSFNNQCWRHSCLDPVCTINREMKNIYSRWAATGHPLVVNRDEIGNFDSFGSPGCDMLPSESVLYRNFREYTQMGCSGSHFCVMGPYPRFLRYAKDMKPFYGSNDWWYAMWQTCYLSARFEWDVTRNYEREYEEANSLYYGRIAWEGAMREFRRGLEKAFFETPGCIGWGSGAPLGRCLDQAGMEDRLKSLLAKAVELAQSDPDPRALRHVAMEKSVFERTWLVARKSYLENFRELNVYRRKGEIIVDGVLDEADWRNADVLTNFKAPDWGKVKTADLQQTFVRVVYDRDNLYVAVEAMEPTPAMMKADKTVDRIHGYADLGNHLELFYSYPDMADRCYQLMINSEGQIVDMLIRSVSDKDNAFKTSSRWAVKKGSDRWTLEIAIPCSEIGQNCFDGATWRLNVARQREVEGAPRESSSACGGGFYAPATFINMKFTPSRAAGIGQGRDTAPWKNAGFEATRPNPTDRRFTWTRWTSPDVPKEWNAARTPGRIQTENGNRYIHIEGHPETDVSQYFIGPGKGVLHTTFRARGKGRLCLWTGNYVDHLPGVPGYRMIDGTSKNNLFDLTSEWMTYSIDTPKLGLATERVAHRFRLRGESVFADIDDVFVTPQLDK